MTLQVDQALTLNVLGLGRVDARIERLEPLDYHGIRGLGHKVTVRLPHGEAVEGLSLGGRPPYFLDPRYRLA